MGEEGGATGVGERFVDEGCALQFHEAQKGGDKAFSKGVLSKKSCRLFPLHCQLKGS